MNKYILCFLCLRPNCSFLSFISKLKNEKYDIYVSIDDNNYVPDKKWDNINFIQIDNDICRESGYRSVCGWFDNKACSKDKALYYFNTNKINYDYIWLIEDDTFVPSENTIKNIDDKYHNYDFLTPPLSTINILSWDGWEKLIKKQFYWLKKIQNKEYFNYNSKKRVRLQTMTCAIRLSKKFMNHIQEFVDIQNTLFMDELFFIYIARENNLYFKAPKELFNITWDNEWKITDININNLYHPIKDFSKQNLFRI